MSETILIIDSDAEILEKTSKILALAGYETAIAESGEEGLHLVEERAPVLILCDMLMASLDGHQVLKTLENKPGLNRGQVAFIFMCEKLGRAEFRYSMSLGADDCIEKPFTANGLLSLVASKLKKIRTVRSIIHWFRENEVSKKRAILSQADLLTCLQTKKTERKKIIYIEGSAAGYLYYVHTGKVKAFKTHKSGKEFVTAIYSTGDFFGYCALQEDLTYRETTAAMENSVIGLISREEFQKKIGSSPEAIANIVGHLSKSIIEAKENLIELAYQSASRRVSKALLYLSVRHREITNEPLCIPLNRNDISGLAGIMPESVSRTLNELKCMGIIEVHKRLLRILDFNRLKNYSSKLSC